MIWWKNDEIWWYLSVKNIYYFFSFCVVVLWSHHLNNNIWWSVVVLWSHHLNNNIWWVDSHSSSIYWYATWIEIHIRSNCTKKYNIIYLQWYIIIIYEWYFLLKLITATILIIIRTIKKSSGLHYFTSTI